MHDYSKDVSVTTRSQSKSEHCCNLCLVARKNDISKPSTKPSMEKSKSATTDKPEVMKVCCKCFSTIHPGYSHHCTKDAKVNNLAQMAGNDVDKLVARSLRSKSANDNNVSLNNSRGKPSKIKLSERSQQRGKLSHQQMLNIKKQLNLSTRKVVILDLYFVHSSFLFIFLFIYIYIQDYQTCSSPPRFEVSIHTIWVGKRPDYFMP